jgi:hypothetical protein
MKSQNLFYLSILVLGLAAVAAVACKAQTPYADQNVVRSGSEAMGGFEGVVTDSQQGFKVSGVQITFKSEDGTNSFETKSDENGYYRIDLPAARYTVNAYRDGYEPYSTGSGFFVATGSGYQTGNISLVPKQEPGSGSGSSTAGGTAPEGLEWHVGTEGVSCTDVCASFGGYHYATRVYAGSDGSADNCLNVLKTLNIPLDSFYKTKQGGIGCSITRAASGNYLGYWDEDPTSPDATRWQRVCACKVVNASNPPATGVQIIVNNPADHVVGPFPVLRYALTDPSGQDIYPLGEGAIALYGIYDTGSNKVRLSTTPQNRLTYQNWGKSDIDHLRIYYLNYDTVNLRLNGLQKEDANGNVPLGTPGTENPAQMEVRNITVKPENVDVTLIGAPVANRIVALLNFSNKITGLFAKIETIEINMYQPGDPNIPAVDVWLPLEELSLATPTDIATAGYRYWLRNVAFQNGNGSVSDRADGLNFLFDTGTTITIINDAIAKKLNLQSKAASFDCYGGKNNGYFIDYVRMTGAEGMYQVNNASVCWKEDAIHAGDAVIGTNFFDQVQIVVDGPSVRLGIKQPSSPGGPSASNAVSGVQGAVTDSQQGSRISGVEIIFKSEDGNSYETKSDEDGYYRVDLPPARYYVYAYPDGYEPYSSGSSLSVVPGPRYQVEDISLVAKPISGISAGGGIAVEGFWWYFGPEDASCTVVCSAHGGYNAATRSYAGSDGTPENCQNVLKALNIPLDRFGKTTQDGIGCFAIQLTSGNYGGLWDAEPTEASATYGTPGRRRVCACNQ